LCALPPGDVGFDAFLIGVRIVAGRETSALAVERTEPSLAKR
jgi:hypothetical protein